MKEEGEECLASFGNDCSRAAHLETVVGLERSVLVRIRSDGDGG